MTSPLYRLDLKLGLCRGLVVAAVLILGACGGGAEDASGTPNLATTDVSGVTTGAAASRPLGVPSGYVRYEGQFYSQDPNDPTPPYRKQYEDQLRLCDYMRVTIKQLAPQRPQISDEVLANADRDTRIEIYDHLTGATRSETHHVYPELVINQSGSSAECLTYRLVHEGGVGIVSSDGHTYGMPVDRLTGEPTTIYSSRTNAVPVNLVPWSRDWARRFIAGEECVQAPAAGDGTFGSTRCNWSVYEGVQFRNLPMALESVAHVGTGFHHREVAVYATTNRSNFGEWATTPIDRLPEGLPVVTQADPLPDDDEPPASPKPNQAASRAAPVRAISIQAVP